MKNRAGYNGGALYSQNTSVKLLRCVLSKNKADFGHGGGLYVFDSYNPTVYKCVFRANSAMDGGGIYIADSGQELVDTAFQGNSAEAYGGDSGQELVDTAFQGNSAEAYGGGMACRGSIPILANCTFHDNSAGKTGGAFHCTEDSLPEITNSIFWKDHAPEGSEIGIGTAGQSSTLTISHSDVDGGQEGVYVHANSSLVWMEGMIDSDPLFVDPGRGDLHLLYPSPCRDTGYIFGIMDLYDFEGDERNFNKIADMGIDEFHPHLYCTGEAVPGCEIVVKVIGQPGRTVMLLVGSEILDPPVETPYGDLHLASPFIAIDLGTVPWNGLIKLDQQIPPDCSVPLTVPMQALVRGQLTNLCKIEVTGP
jgi:predicted outer membrane repeat protein